jgi:phosphatidylglycerophosphatase A
VDSVDQVRPTPVEKIVATGFFTGYIPGAPATAGSALAAALYWWVFPRHPVAFAGITVVVFFIGVVLSYRLERVWGTDPRQIVIDEFVGLWIALFLMPKSVAVLGGGFLLFRIFDVAKPFPIHRSQKLPGGWGIMIDDVLAGIYTHLALRVALVLLPLAFSR